MKPIVIWALFFVVIVTHYVETYSVLHKILNVRENASVEELKVAYEKLLHRWYKASRSLTAEAELLHLKIVQTYRELKTRMGIDFHDKHFLSSKYYKSAVQSVSIEALHSISVPLKIYNEELLKNSYQNLHLVLFYSLNSSCSNIIHNWFNLLEILTPLGVVMVTVNMDNEDIENVSFLIDDYPSSLPYLVLLIDGVSIPYNNEFIDFMILDFVRRNLPENLFEIITDVTLEYFLNPLYSDNKVRALIYQPSLPIRLQYLLIIFIHRENVKFGFVNLKDKKAFYTQRKMNVSNGFDTFLMFKENNEVPNVRITMSSIPAKLFNDTVSKNRALVLPRITSQKIFDQICPVFEYFKASSICVILVLRNSWNAIASDSEFIFRRFAEEYSHLYSDVSFMYVYNDYQPEFVLPIEEFSNAPYIVALRRVDKNHVNYTVLINDLTNWTDYELMKNRLKIIIDKIIKNKQISFINTVKINDFVDEKSLSLIYRIFLRLRFLTSKITIEQSLPYIICIITAFYFISVFKSYWKKIQWLVLPLLLLIYFFKLIFEVVLFKPCKRK